MRLVILDNASLDCGDLDFSKLKALGLEFDSFENTKPDQIVERIKDADIIITNKVVIDSSTLKQVDKLKLICIAATGTNNVDLIAAHEKGIMVCNVTGYATSSVVQHVFMLITALNTKLNSYQKAVKNGLWSQSEFFCLLDFPTVDLSKQTIGIIGYGELGKGVEKVARAFGMKVLVSESLQKNSTKTDERISLTALLKKSDIVTLHCPLTPETKNIISTNEFKLMKSSALLINTARGGIVDEIALLEALQQNLIAGAGIDVLENEPPDKDNKLLTNELDNLIITPHIAWASVASRQCLLDGIVKNIEAFLKGDSRNIVNN